MKSINDLKNIQNYKCPNRHFNSYNEKFNSIEDAMKIADQIRNQKNITANKKPDVSLFEQNIVEIKKKSPVVHKTDEEIQRDLEKAKENNDKFKANFNESTNLDDVLSSLF